MPYNSSNKPLLPMLPSLLKITTTPATRLPSTPTKVAIKPPCRAISTPTPSTTTMYREVRGVYVLILFLVRRFQGWFLALYFEPSSTFIIFPDLPYSFLPPKTVHSLWPRSLSYSHFGEAPLTGSYKSKHSTTRNYGNTLSSGTTSLRSFLAQLVFSIAASSFPAHEMTHSACKCIVNLSHV